MISAMKSLLSRKERHKRSTSNFSLRYDNLLSKNDKKHESRQLGRYYVGLTYRQILKSNLKDNI